MQVRAIQKEDILALTELENACFEERWSQGQISGSMARVDFCGVIAEENEKAVGYIFGTCLFEDAEIARIAVIKDSRRKGIGFALMDGFLTEVKKRNAERVFLEVRKSNLPAVSLYQKCGFTPTRVRERYYVDGEDALEMKKEL
jgi:ribosomal-protein-alanine N-acetyltransferase